MTSFTFGADPEVFIRDRSTGQFTSAHPFFPGTKKDPFPVDNGAVQVDGMALEFNIHPASTEREFVQNITSVMRQMKEMVAKANPDFELVLSPVANFDPIDFMLYPLEPKLLGCDPDYDDNGNLKRPPDGMQDLPFRTAAGHIHIGWTKVENPTDPIHMDNCKIFAKTFKNAEGYTPRTKEERQRCSYYGAPGSFRPKKYGVELRSPSNLWLEDEGKMAKMFRETYRLANEIGNKYEM